MRRSGAVAICLAVALIAAACTGADAASRALPGRQVDPLVSDLPTVATSTLPSMRLADGLTPPTNRWFSGLVFGDEPQPVFPLPLSFALVEDGFSFGVPTVSSTPGHVSAPGAADLTVTAGGGEQTVTRYDEVSVSVAVAGGEVTIARGSPLVAFTTTTETTLRLSASLVEQSPGHYTTTGGGREYGLVTTGAVLDGTGLTLGAGGSAVWFPVPDDASASDLFALASTPVDRVTTTFATGDASATTTLRYSDDEPILIGVLPHQLDGLIEPTDCGLGTFATVYGEMTLCAGTTLRWSVPTVEPRGSLDLSALGSADRDELVRQLGRDIAATRDIPSDTYFGGKALARLATLLQLARELDDDAAESSLRTTLVAAVREWTQVDGCERRSERCFAYDPDARGIVGQAASFGSDAFNDHHFHYGYFLFAAGVAAEDDSALAAEFSPVMTLLAADIASGTTTDSFPVRRVFDPYSGHSWASGYSEFRDGNNQESSSEAVAAWNGLAQWAVTAGDDGLLDEARWMLSTEAYSATRYWLDFDTAAEPWAGYDRSVVGIVWDGKRDYGTWFSAEPSAILGIQLLPLAPVDYLAADPARIRANVAEAMPAGQFADYLLMYGALAGPDDAADALAAARDLPEAAIDDGNSRSYLMAWIMAQL